MATSGQRNVHLQTLINKINDRYIFNEANYPNFDLLRLGEQEAFILAHSIFHISKSIGRIAGECEKFDHGKEIDKKVIEEGVLKMLINTLKLASEFGLTAKDISKLIPKHLKK